MNISIFASLGAGNLGDELIVKNEIQLLKQEFGSETRFRVFTYDVSEIFYHDSQVLYLEYFPIASSNPRNIVRNIRNFFFFITSILWSQRVVIGGGGIIYDSEIQAVRSPLDQWIFRTNIARFFHKKIYFFAVGIDIKKEENFLKLKKIFKKAWKITLRDVKSQAQLQKIGISSDIIDDPVMSDNSDQEYTPGKILGTHSSKSFRLPDFGLYDLAEKKIGLALRSGYFGTTGNTDIEKLIVQELCSYLESRGAKIIFLPHSFHPTDTGANDYEFLKQFLTLEREICASVGEVYTIYKHKRIDSIISMRLHSIILAHVYGIDQIVLSYSQKTDEVIKKIRQ